jgi:hypothetical protein
VTGPTLELTDDPGDDHEGRVPPPLPPEDPDAWYAEDVRAQREVHPGVVTTVRETDEGFAYDLREPRLDATDERALDAVREHFENAQGRRPLTREGTRERAETGFPPKYRRVLDRLVDSSPAARRRIEYYALRDLRCLGPVTPLALDEAIEIADSDGDRLVVHTDRFAPAQTDFDAESVRWSRTTSSS